MRTGLYIFSMTVAFLAGALVFRACGPAAPPAVPTTRCDTVVLRDTVRLPVPAAEVVAVVRYDTIPAERGCVPADTVPADTILRITPDNDVVLPITRRVYRTEDYAATVEGYRARLVGMELYPKTMTITHTRSPRWALTAGPGIGYGPNGVHPYVGVTAGFVLWSK